LCISHQTIIWSDCDRSNY